MRRRVGNALAARPISLPSPGRAGAGGAAARHSCARVSSRVSRRWPAVAFLLARSFGLGVCLAGCCACASWPASSLVCVVLGLRLFGPGAEQLAHHLLERRLLDRQVDDRQRGQSVAHHGLQARVRHRQHGLRRVGGDDGPQLLELGALDRARQAHGEALVGPHPAHQRLQVAVVDQPAVVDDDDARAERGHVVHVVAGEQHRRAEPLVVVADEVAHLGLHRDVEPDGRLVEEQHARPVEQRRHQLALHPLAQRQLAGRLVDEVADLQQLDQLAHRLVGLRARDVVDRAVHGVGLRRRQIPEELLLLPHHQRDELQEARVAILGDVRPDPHRARRRVQQAGQHLERGRLPGAVRAEEADALALADLERQLLDRLDAPRTSC